jgi:hypothetical protein
MVFLIRHEVARALLSRVGRAVLIDRVPVRFRRSRWDHVRNGTGSILEAGSRVAWRPSPFVTLYYLTRAGVRSELGYGLDELGRALRPPKTARGRALAATLLGLAAALVLTARAHRPERPHPLPGVSAGPEAAPSPPMPTTVGS